MSNIHTLYAIELPSGEYFAGFDPAENKAITVSDPREAKLFSNKFEIKLRPQEVLREVEVTLTDENTRIGAAFRPRKQDRSARAVTSKPLLTAVK